MSEMFLIHKALHSEAKEVLLDGVATPIQIDNEVHRLHFKGVVYETTKPDPSKYTKYDLVTRVIHTGRPWQYIVNDQIIE
jgi:hypothetical protein